MNEINNEPLSPKKVLFLKFIYLKLIIKINKIIKNIEVFI